MHFFIFYNKSDGKCDNNKYNKNNNNNRNSNDNNNDNNNNCCNNSNIYNNNRRAPCKNSITHFVLFCLPYNFRALNNV